MRPGELLPTLLLFIGVVIGYSSATFDLLLCHYSLFIRSDPTIRSESNTLVGFSEFIIHAFREPYYRVSNDPHAKESPQESLVHFSVRG